MQRDEAGDLLAFMAVAEEGSFTRAAAKLATSQSALSHTVRRLETRLGLRLLARTTRSVALTEAGERLLRTIGPAFAVIDGGVAALGELRDKPAGTIRMTTSEHAAHMVLWPVLSPLLHSYPDLHVELVIDSGLTDIVAERFDAGVRLGESIAKDMVAVRIGATSPSIAVSICGCRPPADYMPGNWRKVRAASTCVSTGSSSSTTLGWSFARPRTASAWRACSKTWSTTNSPAAA
jgi:DNA-binding transcriptional LysR family regulator